MPRDRSDRPRAHGQTVSYGYIGVDDEDMIEQDHEFLRDPSKLPRAFTRDLFGMTGSESPYYRPIETISLMIDTQLGGTCIPAR